MDKPVKILITNISQNFRHLVFFECLSRAVLDLSLAETHAESHYSGGLIIRWSIYRLHTLGHRDFTQLYNDIYRHRSGWRETSDEDKPYHFELSGVLAHHLDGQSVWLGKISLPSLGNLDYGYGLRS